MSAIRRQLTLLGFKDSTITIILASWRKSTACQYQTYLSRWITYCQEHTVEFLSPSISEALDFLSSLYEIGLSYSSINTARSMLSSILQLQSNVAFGQLPVVKRFMKGIFELRPALPRYKSVWDIHVVFNFLREKSIPQEQSLKDLTLHLTFLLALLSGQRCQTIKCLSIDNMEVSEDCYIFKITEKVKQTRPGVHIQPLNFQKYPIDAKLCVVTYLREYIKRTSSLRGSAKQLLISFVKPHAEVSKDSISRWCKTVLTSSGIDTSKFKSHSTRAASASLLADSNVNIKDILISAGWSNEKTFRSFYHKPLETNDFNYGQAIMISCEK